jgi:coenzyme F420 hydrogenase subunit beta
MVTKVKGAKELLDEVINTGLCTLCGACSGSCPYLISYKGRMVLMDNCNLSEGQCYQYCPRTHVDMDALSREVFNVPYDEQPMGIYKEVLIARSADLHTREKGQYGGTVTTLISLAMKEGLIDKAILTRTNNDKVPEPVLVENEKDVLQCAGSSYMACPVIERFNKIPKDDSFKVGMVTTPCQGLALSKMKLQPTHNRLSIDNLKLVIGLFCTWALSADRFHRFLMETLNIPLVKKFDIPPPPANTFDAYTSSGKISISLNQVRNYTMPTCAYCLDMTSEFADISVGSVEGIEGWNTVIVRTKAGEELISVARKKGAIETGILPPENLEHLKDAAMIKKKRALREIIKRTGDQKNLLYLGLSQSVADKLIS